MWFIYAPSLGLQTLLEGTSALPSSGGEHLRISAYVTGIGPGFTLTLEMEVRACVIGRFELHTPI